MINLKKLCSVLAKKCCFIVSEPVEMDVLNRDQGKTPSVHDCTQISIVNSKSTIISTPIEILKLNLSVIDSVKMIIGTSYEIFPYGLKGSLRNSKDGCVYAGSSKGNGMLQVNDIVLNEEEKGVGSRHFMIQYFKEKGNYMIKDMGEGMGTFIRLDNPLKLQNNFIVSFGESHVIIQVESQTLNLRFIDGPRNEEKFVFKPENSPIKLGRMADCDIKFDDNSLSRYHCLVYYDTCWILKDGDGEKLSTNGTWLFAENFFEVFDGMTYKAAETLFKVQLSNELANIKS